jgi:hypothetical protein
VRCSVALLALLAAGCIERPTDTLLLCHNSNCAEPHDPSKDDTVGAMMESLALADERGIPLIDGIELDVFQHQGQCLYAHDVDHLDGHIELRDAVQMLADHLTTHPRPSHNGMRFNVKLELKPSVDGRGDFDAQITCSLDAYEILRTAALASGLPIEVVFDSYDPALLRGLTPRLPSAEAAIWPKLSLDFGIPPPLRADNYDLDRLDVDLDVIEIHGSWITDTALRALRSRRQRDGRNIVDVTLWSFDLTRETLAQLSDIEPTFALTGQAQTLRAWLDR